MTGLQKMAIVVLGIVMMCTTAYGQDCLKGDVNLDGVINFADVQPLRDLLTDGVFQCEGDVNSDGLVNTFDISAIGSILLDQQDSNFVDVTSGGPGDFFWSASSLDTAASNAPFFHELFVGDTETFYVYYSINGSAGEVNIGAALNVATSNSGIIQFTNAGTYNFNIEVVGNPVGTRWTVPDLDIEDGMAFGSAESIEDELIVGMAALTTSPGSFGDGMVADSITAPFADIGYNPDAGEGAFLFGMIEFTAVAGGDVTLMAGPNVLGVGNQYELLDVSIAAAQIHVVLPGDVNLDNSVNLLDVAPFVELLQQGGYQAEADCNHDGVFNLLDVALFIEKLSS